MGLGSEQLERVRVVLACTHVARVGVRVGGAGVGDGGWVGRAGRVVEGWVVGGGGVVLLVMFTVCDPGCAVKRICPCQRSLMLQ